MAATLLTRVYLPNVLNTILYVCTLTRGQYVHDDKYKAYYITYEIYIVLRATVIAVL